VNRERLSAIAHTTHPVAAPLSDAGVREVIDRVVSHQPQSVLDIGCGSGQWLVELLQRLPNTRGVGVDVSAVALQHAEALAASTGVADQLTLHQAPAQTLDDAKFDALLCIGSTHALGGLAGTLTEMHRWAASRAVVVVGDGFWERPPSDAALTALDCTADEFPSYADFVDAVAAAGWDPVHVRTSRADEWDDYEWSWVSDLAKWAAAHPDDHDAADAVSWARQHRDQWLRGYRGTLGFAVVTATRAS
jgi:ubiquinone/menaquinone biosynthesis C-methylase UbiE